MPRGRGTLEVRPSNSPFFQTSASVLGADLNHRPFARENSTQDEASTSKSFLFTRESDNFGLHVTTEDYKKEYERLSNQPLPKITLIEPNDAPAIDTEKFAASYNYNKKEEHSLYTTSSNSYGFNKPSAATVIAERQAKKQDFSKQFANIKPRNSSMNTAITRSTIHSSLDPQFL